MRESAGGERRRTPWRGRGDPRAARSRAARRAPRYRRRDRHEGLGVHRDALVQRRQALHLLLGQVPLLVLGLGGAPGAGLARGIEGLRAAPAGATRSSRRPVCRLGRRSWVVRAARLRRESGFGALFSFAARPAGLSMANIASQKKRIARTERERQENLRFGGTVKTHFNSSRRLSPPATTAPPTMRTGGWSRAIDKAVQKGAMHKNTGARKKARAADRAGLPSAAEGRRSRRPASGAGASDERTAPQPARRRRLEARRRRPAQREGQRDVLGVVRAAPRPQLQVGDRADGAVEARPGSGRARVRPASSPRRGASRVRRRPASAACRPRAARERLHAPAAVAAPPSR